MNGRTLLAGLLLLGPIVAGSARAFDPATQIHESDLIVTGHVVAVRDSADPLGRGLEAEVEIADVWKGSSEAGRLVVRTPGGALSNPGLALEGSARFVEGEDVLLFLTREQDGWRPWRTVFGKYSIRGSGADARLVGLLPPAFEGLDPSALVSMHIEEARQEVRVIAASRRSDGGVDVALH